MIAHLKIHTEFSILDSIIRLEGLFSEAKKKNIVAIALTDICNLFGAIKFYKQSINAGIKPIFGVELKINTEFGISDLVLLSENNYGYQNIINLISKAYKEADRVNSIPIIPKFWLKKINLKNTICLNGGQKGELGKAILSKNNIKINKIINDYIEIFGINNYIIEIHKLRYKNENFYNEQALKYSIKYNLITVATNLALFLEENDYNIHEIKSCINKKITILDNSYKSEFTKEQYLKSSKDMYKDFYPLTIPVDNTINIARRCNVIFNLDKIYLPTINIPYNLTEKEYFLKLCYNGLNNRLKTILINKPLNKIPYIKKKYKDRLDKEINIIYNMGFLGYFLIIEDFVRWSKKNNIPVGPGRGSGAGSLVAYVLLITEIDPILYGLIFERFLNPERISMPDFDIDFCIKNRDRVIKYVEEKYGKDNVAQIITYNTMAVKLVIRDVARVMGYDVNFSNRITKMIPEKPGITFDKILKPGELLYNEIKINEEVADIIEKAKKLEGLVRSLSKHAAGIVISPKRITNFVPIYSENKNSDIITQFDKSDIETIGLIKFDFLGLKNLTIINDTINNIVNKKLSCKKSLDISNLPLNDEKTFKLLQSGKTVGIFQLESQGIRRVIKKINISSFKDIIALVALYRPGPMDNIFSFIERKQKRKKIIYLHHLLKDILEETYGIPIYQEQVIQIAQKLAGYSPGSADILRRAMSKKNSEEMNEQRKIFQEGAAKYNNINSKLSNEIFNQMESFAKYGFNKSHATAYAFITYQTAWLKANYPDEYMANLMSGDITNTTQLIKFILDCKNMGIIVLAPDINKSDYNCIVISKNTILLGLAAIKGLGEEAIKNILIERKSSNKVFNSIFDLCRRIDLHKVNKKALESLCFSGAIKNISKNRATAFNSIKKAIKNASYIKKMHYSGQNDLFNYTNQDLNIDKELEKECILNEWNYKELLINEKKVLGMYFSGHILNIENHWRNYINFTDLSKINDFSIKNNYIRIIVSITSINIKRNIKTGQYMYIINVEDEFNRISCYIDKDIFINIKNNININDIVVIEGEVIYSIQEKYNKVIIKIIKPISQYINDTFNKVKLILRSKSINSNNLKKILINLKKDISLNNITKNNILEIIIAINNVYVKFDLFKKSFSIYNFINDINVLLNCNSIIDIIIS